MISQASSSVGFSSVKYGHGSSCACCSPPLANNRKNVVKPVIAGFDEVLKNEVDGFSGDYHLNVDKFSSAGLSNPSVLLDAHFLSGVVAQMEANTIFFDKKDKKKVVAGNCGKRVMPPALRAKIYGLSSVDYDGSVDVLVSGKSASFAGVMSCHDQWGCMPCARKNSERRKNGLSLLLKKHFSTFGARTVTATLFTAPHSLGDDLKDLLERLQKAQRDLIQSRAYRGLIARFGDCGTSRATEVTYSLNNGFHPHFHVLNFFEKSLSLDDQIFCFDKLFLLWSRYLKKNGFKEPDRRGFGFQIVSSDSVTVDQVAEYFSKVESDVNDADVQVYLKKHPSVRSVEGSKTTGWQVEHEMTKWHLKKAKVDSENYRYSMFDFVRGFYVADVTGDLESKAKFRALWLSYREAFKGSSQLFTRHKHFKIADLEMTDQELAESPSDEKSKVVYKIPFDVWLLVVYFNARGTILEAARTGGASKVQKIIDWIQEAYSYLPSEKKIFSH